MIKAGIYKYRAFVIFHLLPQDHALSLLKEGLHIPYNKSMIN